MDDTQPPPLAAGRGVERLPGRLAALLRVDERRTLTIGFGRRSTPHREDRLAVEAGLEVAHGSAEAALVDGRQLLDDADPVRRLRSVREQLTPRGRLAVALPTTAPRSNLPPPLAKDLRALVRWISEAGYAILHLRALAENEADGDNGTAGTAGTAGTGPAWAVVIARSDPFIIRSATEAADEQRILGLFHATFHGGRDHAGWRWKYRDSPYGSGPISLAFAADGTLACHYAGYPVSFRHRGSDVAALHMGDTMTAAAYRDVGRGGTALLARTVRHFFACDRDGRRAFYYGFNTGPIQRFCQWFIGGSHLAEVTHRLRPLDAAAPMPRSTRYRVAEITGADRSIDRLLARAEAGYGLFVARSAAYLDWRYIANPEADYVILGVRRLGRLVGWSVFRKVGPAIVWGDAFFDRRHPAAAGAILAAALEHPALAGAARIEGWFGHEPAWWHRQLVELGFELAAEPQGLGLVYLADDPVARSALASELYYTKGDGDLF